MKVLLRWSLCFLVACAKTPASPVANPDDAGARRDEGPAVQIADGTRGAVSSAERNATDVGIAILKRGGNAVDAAIAVGFALGVTHPTAGNIGGGGFMLIRFPDGSSTAIDYREVAPMQSTPDMYLDHDGNVSRESRRGPRAAGIPGVVAGFALAHQRYGSLPWADLVRPAVELARQGWALDSFHTRDLAWGARAMRTYAEESAAANTSAALVAALESTLNVFTREGEPYAEGDIWKQPALANTLETIASQGSGAFYKGPLAQRMVASVRDMGGLWTDRDLADYRALERTPIVFDYHGHEIITMPPPSSGGVALRQILGASDFKKLHQKPWNSVERLHQYIEILKRVYADRNLNLGDPDFIKLPMTTLLDVSYLTSRMKSINPERATPSEEIGTGIAETESPETTHFSVVDGARLAVANTFTLNGGFGGKLQIPDTGVTLNNQMDDFTAKVGAPNMFGLVQGPQNAIAPKKRMLSSMSPTIVASGGKLRAVVGSPGGPTIITTVAQIIMQLVDHNRALAEAVVAPRTHHQWLPDRVLTEPEIGDATMERLKAMGHAFKVWERIGHANCIEVVPTTGGLKAVADYSRDGGSASAY